MALPPCPPECGGVACLAGQETLESRSKGVLEVFRGDDKEVRTFLASFWGGFRVRPDLLLLFLACMSQVQGSADGTYTFTRCALQDTSL